MTLVLSVQPEAKGGLRFFLYLYYMKFSIAIPSFRRRALFEKNTYALLRGYGLLPATTVFINREDESDYNDLSGIKIVVRDCKTLVERRDYIYSYFPEGHHIFQMDDDISAIIDLTRKPVASLSDVIERGFRTACEEGCRLWGFYPVANPFFMRQGYSTHLAHIPAVTFGLIKRGEVIVPPEGKSDFYLSCWYYNQDGKIIRLRDVSPIANYYTAPGGRLAISNGRMEEEKQGAEKVLRDFPGWASMKIRKRTGNPELRLRRKVQKLQSSDGC